MCVTVAAVTAYLAGWREEVNLQGAPGVQHCDERRTVMGRLSTAIMTTGIAAMGGAIVLAGLAACGTSSQAASPSDSGTPADTSPAAALGKFTAGEQRYLRDFHAAFPAVQISDTGLVKAGKGLCKIASTGAVSIAESLAPAKFGKEAGRREVNLTLRDLCPRDAS